MGLKDLGESLLSNIGNTVQRAYQNTQKYYEVLSQRSDREVLKILNNPPSFSMRLAAMKIALERGLVQKGE